MENYKSNEKDELRARFTHFLERLVGKAQIDYLRKIEHRFPVLSIDDIPEESFAKAEPMSYGKRTAFDFEEERLARAFSSLPLMRQQILTLLFVEEWKPAQIAKHLNCSVEYVYNQRFLAIKKLRQLLQEEGDGR